MEPPNSEAASEPRVYGDQATPIPIDVFGNTSTLENTLQCLGLFSTLYSLDKSLEDVKRNKNKKEDHAEIFKSVNKSIQRLSLEHHPDRLQTGSDLQKARAHEMQSSINVTRTVLRTLTEEFLGNIDIDYKYAYFAHLDVRSLVNQSEIDSQLRDVLYKICELSEIKRVHIVGEIRKFLVESQKCVRSYLEKPGDFIKYRDYALFHLKKCIGGYSELIQECEMLEKECSRDGEENMRRIIHEVNLRSSTELRILASLRESAKDSVRNNFQIFNITQYMDDYFVLPFVYYVNVLLMCNATVEKKKFLNFRNVDHFANPFFEMEPTLFADAYHLAVHLYDGKECVEAVEFFMKEKYPEARWTRDEKNRIKIPESLLRKHFRIILEKIMNLLETKYRIDAYSEGKSNRQKLNERLETLKKAMADLQAKEKCLRENISIYEKENQEIRKKCEEVVMKNEKAEKEMRENIEQSEKAGGRPLLKREGNAPENSGVFQNYNRENEIEMELDKIEEKGEELHKTTNQKITEFLSDIQQNSGENEPHASRENEGENDPHASRENEPHVSRENEGENEGENEPHASRENEGENEPHASRENEPHASRENDLAAEKDVEIVQKIEKSLKESKAINKELYKLLLKCVRNITKNSGKFGNKNQENVNELRQILKDSERMKRRINESRDLVKQLLNQRS